MTRASDLARTGELVGSSGYLRNRVINGDMTIDQRNVGGPVTFQKTGSPTGGVQYQYITDRFRGLNLRTNGGTLVGQQDPGIFTPDGIFRSALRFTNTTGGATAATDDIRLYHSIEGYNCNDLAFGSNIAKTVTLSFWVYSSLSGTFSVHFRNNAANRSYVTTYVINNATNWEHKTVTIPGDTSGTWSITNVTGLGILWDLGVGSNYATATTETWLAGDYRCATGTVKLSNTTGATWYITGVQLELGSVATPFERRMFGYELALCQRYYEKSYNLDVVPGTVDESGGATFYVSGVTGYVGGGIQVYFKVSKRVIPTYYNTYSPVTGTIDKIYQSITAADLTASYYVVGMNGFRAYTSQANTSQVNYRMQWAVAAEL